MSGMDEWQQRMNAAMEAGSIRVACKCGWQGMQSELGGQFTLSADRYCPECRAEFKAVEMPKIDKLIDKVATHNKSNQSL